MIDLNSDGKIFIGLTNLTKKDLAELIYKRIYDDDPALFDKYGEEGKKNIMNDILFHLSYLSEAYNAKEPKLFVDYVIWCKMYFNSIKLPLKWIVRGFEIMRDVLNEKLKQTAENNPVDVLNLILAQFDKYPVESNSFLVENSKLGVLSQQYLNALLRKDRHLAAKLIKDALTTGVSIKDIYLHVFQNSQYEVGRLWQSNKINVAMEHYCTASTQSIMSQLYEYIFSSEKIGKKLIATSVSGELHELGIRMVSDFFELEGWDTYYLGANTPHNSVIDMIKATGADVLAISATIPIHISKVQKLITDVRNDIPSDKIKIMVGGKPFNDNPELWQKVNADVFAHTAEKDVKKANLFVNSN